LVRLTTNKECASMAAYDNIRDMRDDTRAELARLRAQVADLMEDRVNPALSDAATRAGKAAKRARAYTYDGADAVSERVRDQPLVAIGVAAAVGYVLGRIAR
jgi:ElaB/YqjD/DUF883 family membrane-anchored ribosome-binding protein